MHERAISNDDGGHLDLEDLAALVDGTLPPEEVASAQAHLAHCERCLAIFTETASFLGEDQEEIGDIDHVAAAATPALATAPLPFGPRAVPPPPPRPRRGRWAAAAAAVAAAAVLAIAVMVSQRSPQQGLPQVETARLLASLTVQQAAALPYWGKPAQRGASTGADTLWLTAFRLGVEQPNLDVAWKLGNKDRAGAAAAHTNGLLDKITAPDAKKVFKGLPAKIDSGAPAASFAGELETARKDLEGYLDRDLPYYELGRWTEAGRLAAAAKAADYLTAPDTRRFARVIRGELPRRLDPRADKALDEIARILGHDRLTAEDYETLGARFQDILQTYYPV